MSKKPNASGGERTYWGVIPVMPGQQLMDTARQMEALGYAGIWRTGDAAFDREVMDGLGLADNEEIIGFLYLGSREGDAKQVPALDTSEFVRDW